MESMNRSSLYTLHTYTTHANSLVLQTAAKMTEEELVREASPSHGSVKRLLVHVFGCEYFFLMECMNSQPEDPIGDPQDLSLATLMEWFGVLNDRRERYLARVNDYELQEVITVDLGRSQPSLPRWQFMAQSLLHSAHHRGELSIVMTNLGYPLPTLDPILLYASQAGQSLS